MSDIVPAGETAKYLDPDQSEDEQNGKNDNNGAIGGGGGEGEGKQGGGDDSGGEDSKVDSGDSQPNGDGESSISPAASPDSAVLDGVSEPESDSPPSEEDNAQASCFWSFIFQVWISHEL